MQAERRPVSYTHLPEHAVLPKPFAGLGQCEFPGTELGGAGIGKKASLHEVLGDPRLHLLAIEHLSLIHI